jgi:hypothetical protein
MASVTHRVSVTELVLGTGPPGDDMVRGMRLIGTERLEAIGLWAV